MAFVAHNPTAVLTAGKSTIAVVTAIADITKPTATELNAITTTTIECATEAFNSTTESAVRERKMLCHDVAVEVPSTRKYQVDDLVIMIGDPQTETVSAKFALDTVVYLVHRPGVTHTTAFTAAEKVQVIKARTAAVDLRAISTGEGDEYAIVVKFAIEDRTNLLVPVVA